MQPLLPPDDIQHTTSYHVQAINSSGWIPFKTLRDRAGNTLLILYVFCSYCLVKVIFLQQLIICCFQYNRTVGTTPYGKRRISEPNLGILCSISWKKAYMDPKYCFNYQVDHEKVCPCCVCIPWSCACILVILQPLTRKTTLRGSCFTVVRGWFRSEWDWLTLSPKFNVKQHRWREN